jgi:anti-anti-sigma factor
MNISKVKYNKWYIVTINGSFVMRNLSTIRNTVNYFEKKEQTNIAFDLSKTTFFDSSALNFIRNYKTRLISLNGDLVIIKPSSVIKDIFSIINIENNVLTIFNSYSEFETYVRRKDFE